MKWHFILAFDVLRGRVFGVCSGYQATSDPKARDLVGLRLYIGRALATRMQSYVASALPEAWVQTAQLHQQLEPQGHMRCPLVLDRTSLAHRKDLRQPQQPSHLA